MNGVKHNKIPAGIGAVEVLKQANALIFAEDAEGALRILTAFLDDRDNPEVWMKLARVYLLLGDVVVARAIYRNVVLKMADPHIMNIIAAKIPYCKVLVLDKLRAIYFNIPKCGSSSVKDAILLVHQMERRGETSHFHVKNFERVLTFSSLREDYQGYTTLAIIRHPRERLRSYYNKNIVEAKSLYREAGGKESYYGLRTIPDYNDIISNFRRYRCVFDDFRHHTDSLIGYLGLDKMRLDHMFDLSETDKVIGMLGALGKVPLPDIRNMQSMAHTVTEEQGQESERELIFSYYKKELDLFFDGLSPVSRDRPGAPIGATTGSIS